MKNDRISVALLGAGRIGQEHAKNLAAFPQVEVVVVCDPRIEGAETLRALVRARDVTPSPEEAVNRNDVDAVVICTPTDTHAALIEAAAETGKAIFCEKPVALDLARTQRALGTVAKRWCDADNGAAVEVNNPATGEILGTVPLMGRVETRRAIEAAKRAWTEWRRRPAQERSVLLRKWHDLMLANVEDLGKLMTAEQGRPLAEAKGEVAYAARFIEWFAEEAKRVYGDTIPSPWNDRRLVVVKQPIGVCAAMTPWNFPAAMITRKAGPALASGCTMVAKPASATPFSALALAVLAERAGVPP